MAIKSLIEYSGEWTRFDSTNEQWILGYKRWMIERGRKPTTANIYLRCLKVVWNAQIKKGKIHPKQYPFKNILIGASRRTKKALFDEDIKKLQNYKPAGDAEELAVDFWFFCYLCNGMNPADALRLKFKNLKGGTILFRRSKTKHNDDLPEIQVPLHPKAAEIIEKHGWSHKDPDWYIFTVLREHDDEDAVRKKIKRFRNYYNKKLKTIGKKLKLTERPVLGISRHSFATRLMLKGFKDAAGEMLGHVNPSTTEHYLATLPNTHLRKITDLLLDD